MYFQIFTYTHCIYIYVYVYTHVWAINHLLADMLGRGRLLEALKERQLVSERRIKKDVEDCAKLHCPPLHSPGTAHQDSKKKLKQLEHGHGLIVT